MAEPPGGPPDTAPPSLIGTYPDSLEIVPKLEHDVEFRFDEIVSEGTTPNFGLGSGDLEKLVLLSPTEKVPSVHWKRNRITVRPAEGWKPNRVYRVELLPGIVDLRNNRSKNGRVVTFTTGAPLPTRTLTGRVVDWSTGKPEALGLVEAMLLPDSLRYRTQADSTGRFTLGPMPDGEFVVYGVLDQNKNRRWDPREAFDTVRLAAGRDSAGELWAFKHDTVAARIQTLAANDSLSILVTFNQQLDPYSSIPPDSIRVRLLPDSLPVPAESILTKARYDSVYTVRKDTTKADSTRADSTRADSTRVRAPRDSLARRDSLRAPPDTAAARPSARARRRRDRLRAQEQQPDTADRGPLKTKPILYDQLVIRLKEKLVPGSRYVVDIGGVRSVSGVVGHPILGFQVPEEKKAPADSTKADSTRTDSTKVDSTKADTAKRRAGAAQPPPARPPARPPAQPPAKPPDLGALAARREDGLANG
jgi:hypothetical protein